jgi:hypothetical protein
MIDENWIRQNGGSNLEYRPCFRLGQGSIDVDESPLGYLYQVCVVDKGIIRFSGQEVRGKKYYARHLLSEYVPVLKAKCSVQMDFVAFCFVEWDIDD